MRADDAAPAKPGRTRPLARARDILAWLGALALVGVVAVYLQGLRATRGMDDADLQRLGAFAWALLENDVAAASTVRVALPEGADVDAAVAALERRAREVHMPVRARTPLGRRGSGGAGDEGRRGRRAEAFELCTEAELAALLDVAPWLASHLPCRITLYLDADGRTWLATVDLALLVAGGRPKPARLIEEVEWLEDRLLDIMAAAVDAATAGLESTGR